MGKTRFILFGLFAAICLVVVPIYALGKEGGSGAAPVEVAESDEEAKELFVANCGPCHTLAAAGTDGIVGPNLDEILVTGGANSPEQYESGYARVLSAIACGRAGRMPADILLGGNARDTAAFVAAYAAQIGKGPTVDLETAKKPEAEPCPPAQPSGDVSGSG